ncbi:hypothetical protein [Leptospira noguchii]|uniref:RiboL-PSP-HEPN domain-containing protein n=1 Tax=Leptospira noguchii serovar Autumnalis str. ZUN142 TaxID=1085540 RepID=M6UGA2_9LEPT|nr:hypothetical protein [Leptospira noguchii]EMO40114.1 hypothetical protein LEP1GSC186_0012 [Leptospira noguchii serovar Autumnalis str. ZUN142]UOG50027.1 hypothetical protein MAL00_07280 [Leptospira noguchii]
MSEKPYSDNPLTIRVISFQAAITEVLLVPLYSIPIFEDFPNQIPFHLRSGIEDDMRQIFHTVEDLMANSVLGFSENSSKVNFSHPFTLYEFAYSQMIKHLGERSGPPNFKTIILRQAWTQMIAVWETFLQDALCLVFSENPTALLRFKERTIKWSDIIESENLDELRLTMAQACAKEFDNLPVLKQIEWLEKSNIDLKMSGDELEMLVRNYQLRHIIVHNNGIIDEKYVNIVGGKSDEMIGSEISLSIEMLKGLYTQLEKLGTIFYKEIADKHLKIPKNKQFFQ